MISSLKTKLSLSYIFVALISLFIVSIVTNLILENEFKEYVIGNQRRMSEEIVTLISKQYKGEGEWGTESISDICLYALQNGMIIKVIDGSENVVWDARLHDNTLCDLMIRNMARNMASRYRDWDGEYKVDTYPVYSGPYQVGRVEIGYHGPYFYDDSDIEFITAINRSIMGVGIFSLILSIFIGTLMARRLTKPISNVVAKARMIAGGNIGGRIQDQSNTKEIGELIESVNHLSESLKKQEELRKRLTEDMAHELRTPLAILQSQTEAMIDGIWKPDKERLQSIYEEVLRINRLVGDLENLARYESENLTLEKKNFDISELIQQIILYFEKDFSDKGITLSFTGKKQLICADKDKISQVIINLLSNALKYTESEGKVDVFVAEKGNFVEIRVKDTGMGIPEEDLPYIFERFYRADKSRDRMTGGAGIGLAIAKSIVNAHNGTIEARSKVNEGSEFIITLPKGE